MTPTDSEFQPDKEREYELFLIWRTMSTTMKTSTAQYLNELGITDERLHELAGIRTQKQLAEYLHVDEDTLTNWKRHPIPQKYADIHPRKWLTETVPQIYQHLYNGFLERQDPATAKLLLESAGEYIERSEVKLDGTETLFEHLKAIADSVKDVE